MRSRLPIFVSIVSVCALLANSCTSKTTTVRTLPKAEGPVVVRKSGDTLGYVIEFSERREQKSFKEAFDRFVANYPFAASQRDTVDNYVHILVGPGSRHNEDVLPSMSSAQPPSFSESPLVHSEKAPDSPRSAASLSETPPMGGSVSLYSPRGFLDAALIELVTPSSCSLGAAQAYFDVEAFPGRARLTLAGKVLGAHGQIVSAFEIVEAWTQFIRKNPAEGRVLFSGVRGLEAFIRGKEAVVPGIHAADQRTIMVHAEKGSSLSHALLHCPQRLLPPAVAMGPYFVAGQDGSVVDLLPNPHGRGERPFLDKISIHLGKENNPLLGFSLNKFDVVLLTSTRDLTYARERLLDSAKLLEVARDRYFLSVGGLTPAVREAVFSLVKPQDILSHFVRAEGEVIGGIELDIPPIATPTSFSQAIAERPLVIVFRNDDPTSVRIGEKLVAELSRAGIPAQPKGMAETAYEAALIDRNFSLAVGWVPERILTDSAEKHRLAIKWFNGEPDERKRIAEGMQLSLFTVKTYALCKNRVGLFRDSLSGLFVGNVETPR